MFVTCLLREYSLLFAVCIAFFQIYRALAAIWAVALRPVFGYQRAINTKPLHFLLFFAQRGHSLPAAVGL